MGAHESKEDKEILDLIQDPKLSTYTKNDLKQWEKRFNMGYPNGCITKTQFQTLYAQTHPGKDSAKFTEHIYR